MSCREAIFACFVLCWECWKRFQPLPVSLIFFLSWQAHQNEHGIFLFYTPHAITMASLTFLLQPSDKEINHEFALRKELGAEERKDVESAHYRVAWGRLVHYRESCLSELTMGGPKYAPTRPQIYNIWKPGLAQICVYEFTNGLPKKHLEP